VTVRDICKLTGANRNTVKVHLRMHAYEAVARMRRRMQQDRALTSRYRAVQQALGL
jgi:hypothetical protein